MRRSRRNRPPDGFDEAGEPISDLLRAKQPRWRRGLGSPDGVIRAVYAGAQLAWYVRLAGWALVAVPVWLWLGPAWIPVSIAAVELAWIAGLHWGAAKERARQRAVSEADAHARAQVFAAFGTVAEPQMLMSGGPLAWRSGDLVFKRAPGEAEWAWLGEHLATVREDGFRLALPVPARDGRWVVDGWCAQTSLLGAQPNEPRWLELLALCERLHLAIRHLPRPPFVEDRTHPWAVADRVAWGEAVSPVGHELLDRLLVLRRPIELTPQVIHGDLTENVLFAEGLFPAVIDPTPYWRPAGYASAIVVGDAIRWNHAEPEPLLAATQHLEAFPQLFVRASIFRLVTTLLFQPWERGPGGLGPYTRDVELAEHLAT